MAYFRAIRVSPSLPKGEGGWVIERTALGEQGGNIGAAYELREEVKAEAARLNALDRGKLGKPHGGQH